jgi:membrane protein
MFVYFGSTLTWRQLLAGTARKTLANDGFGLAAQLAYYFFLALFPALLLLMALASFFPLDNLADTLVGAVSRFAPSGVAFLIRDQLKALSESRSGGLVSLGLLGALWSSSAALVSIIDAMNRAYDITEGRAWWKSRLTAMGLTIVLSVFILVAITLVLAGPELADFLGRRLGFALAFTWTWKVMQWPIVFVLVSVGFGLVYFYAPDAEQEWVWITPGSLLGALLWLAASLAFRVYVVHFGDFDKAYGTLGAIILTLLWFYLAGLAMIIGAEVNAEIEHASPWGKAPGEKVPGEKRRIGLAGARAWYANHPDKDAARAGFMQSRKLWNI